MCRNMDRLFEEERRIGKAEGFNEGKIQGATAEKLETIKYLKKINMPIEQIAEAVRLNEEEIQEWLMHKGANLIKN